MSNNKQFNHLRAMANLSYTFNPYRAVNTLGLGYKNQLMLYVEIIAVCSEIHTKHTTQITFKYSVRTEQ
jgi:hypothetical protein